MKFFHEFLIAARSPKPGDIVAYISPFDNAATIKVSGDHMIQCRSKKSIPTGIVKCIDEEDHVHFLWSMNQVSFGKISRKVFIEIQEGLIRNKWGFMILDTVS